MGKKTREIERLRAELAVQSPSESARLVEHTYRGTNWIEKPVFQGYALNVYQPAEWWQGEG